MAPFVTGQPLQCACFANVGLGLIQLPACIQALVSSAPQQCASPPLEAQAAGTIPYQLRRLCAGQPLSFNATADSHGVYGPNAEASSDPFSCDPRRVTPFTHPPSASLLTSTRTMAIYFKERRENKGFALILVLSIMALLLVAIVSLLGLSSKSIVLAKADSLNPVASQSAEVASQQIIQDLLTEIRAGSIEPKSTPAGTVLYPATSLSAVPNRSSVQTTTTLSPPNLVKQSAGSNQFYDRLLTFNTQSVYPQSGTHTLTPRCSTISTATGSAISAARWNQPLLLPRATPSSPSDMTPATSGTLRFAGNSAQKWAWKAPDWIYLQADGNNPVTFAGSLTHGTPNPVVARYAYQIYDIGGLLDANVAGYDPDPLVVAGSVASRRGSTGLADLTQIGLTASQLKQLLAFRNAATLASPDAGPHGHRYVNFLLNNQSNSGFMRVSGGTSTTVQNRAFTSRSHLVSFLKSQASNDAEKAQILNSLQSLTHFSRSLEQPSFRPGFYDPAQTGSTALSPAFKRPTIVPPAGRMDDILYPINVAPTGTTSGNLNPNDVRIQCKLPFEMALGNNRGGNNAWGTFAERGLNAGDNRSLQDVINPAFLELTVGTLFTRQDGSSAQIGEPLVKKRFPLERLAWVTYKGPSASLPTTDPLYNRAGTPKAILDCMGLTWMKDSADVWFWAYAHGKTGGIFNLEDLLVSDSATGRPREPDFFEMLKAGITVGSLGKSSVPVHNTSRGWDPATYLQSRDRVSEFQVLEVGANLIDQNDADNFPTIIRLPNPDPILNPITALDFTRYNPPLFTARGVEDLPYFYRFHIRSIEDSGDRPSPSLPAPGGAMEITDKLSAYAGDAFKCGTTVVMGFPELWNPHAADPAKPFLAANYPSAFRVVAASEAPGDLVAAPKDATDRGLANNPKLGAIPPSPTSVWMRLVNSSVFDFSIKTIGYFGYSNKASTTSTFLPLTSQILATHNNADSKPMTYNSATQVWNWPIDNAPTLDLTGDRSLSLFWSDAKFLSTGTLGSGTLVLNDHETNYFIAAATLSKLPPLASDGYTPMEDKPANWPAGATALKDNITKKNTLAELPTPGDTAYIYLVGGTNYYIWHGGTSTWASGTYSVLSYPKTPRMADLSLTHNYTVRPSALQYNDGTLLKDPFPAYLLYKRALSDTVSQRKIFQSSIPGSSPGIPAGNAGDTSSRTFDVRGTEMLFAVSSSNIFREPSPLCTPGLPTGSNLKAGPDNFYSGAPYNGSLLDAKGRRWVGISLGEVPTNFILLTKMFKKDRTVTQDTTTGVLSWKTDANDIPLDLTQNKRGEPEDPTSTNPPISPFYPLRYFQVPVTAAGIDKTHFTLRLQFKDSSGTWVTYDERFLEVSNFSDTRYSCAPVLDRNELYVSNSTTPQDGSGNVQWAERNRPLGWSMPVVTSYDPRTPRFGNPFRHGAMRYNAVHGTTAQNRQALNASTTNPSGMFPDGDAPSDRSGSVYVDLPTSKTPPATLTPRGLGPGGWSSWFINGSSGDFNDLYDITAGIKPPSQTWIRNWWAAGKNANGSLLFKKPSGNALDYGWYPRLFKPSTPAGSTPLSSFKTNITTDTTLPNFLQFGFDGAYADSLRMGMLSENIAPSVASTTDPNAPYRQAYADPDDVVRRASGGLASNGGYTTTEGLPLAQGSLTSTNRPIILNRPFRSVAEMGYAFRGTPWKNVTFFLPETGDAALLDLFCLSDTPLQTTTSTPSARSLPLVAGKVNLNTRQEPVVRALLAGALKNEFSQSDTLSPSSDAANAARALIDRTTGTQPWLGPLTNNAQLAGKLFAKDMDLTGIPSSAPIYTTTVFRTGSEPNRNPDMTAGLNQLTWHYTGYSADLDNVFGSTKDRKTQRLRESAIRALADCGQTRVWNLMFDIIVQTGDLADGASSLSTFRKGTEQRLWVYLAIDRFTGQILDRQQEWVTE